MGYNHKMNTFRHRIHWLQRTASAGKSIALTCALVLVVNLASTVGNKSYEGFALSLISVAYADDDDRKREEKERERAREDQKEAQERAEKEAKRARKEAQERAEKEAKRASKEAEQRKKEQERQRAKAKRDNELKQAKSSSKRKTESSSKSTSRSTSKESSERNETKTYKSASRNSEEEAKRDEQDDNNYQDSSKENADDKREDERQQKAYEVEQNDEKLDTLAKVFKKIFSPGKSKSKPTSKSASKSNSQTEKTKNAAKTATTTTKPVSRRARRRFYPPITARARFVPNEVLATNMSPRSVFRARRLGFKVRRGASFARLNLRVNRLIAPRGMSAGRARRLLRRKLPDSRYTLNRVYRIYHAALGREPRPSRKLIERVPRGRSFRRCGTGKCYASKAIRWSKKLRNCARSVKVGVIDTGYDKNHPALRGGPVRIHDAKIASQQRPLAPSRHGTGVLALLTGNPKTTTAGLIPGAEFFMADVFFADKAGRPVSDTNSMLNALALMDAYDVDIINLSLTGPKDPMIANAISALSKKGVIIVAAAGNGGPAAPPSYPAAYSQVIAVTAVNKRLGSYRYANRGSYIDIAAPGVDIWTAMPGNKAGYQSGTSFAAPYVTAVVAAMFRHNGPMSKTQILKQITTRDLGARGRDKIYGRGLVLAPRRCRSGPAIAKAGFTQ